MEDLPSWAGKSEYREGTIMTAIRNYSIAINAIADEIESGTTDFDELRLLAAKHVFDAGGDPNDAYIVDAVINAAGMTANGTRVIDRFERLVA